MVDDVRVVPFKSVEGNPLNLRGFVAGDVALKLKLGKWWWPSLGSVGRDGFFHYSSFARARTKARRKEDQAPRTARSIGTIGIADYADADWTGLFGAMAACACDGCPGWSRKLKNLALGL